MTKVKKHLDDVIKKFNQGFGGTPPLKPDKPTKPAKK